MSAVCLVTVYMKYYLHRVPYYRHSCVAHEYAIFDRNSAARSTNVWGLTSLSSLYRRNTRIHIKKAINGCQMFPNERDIKPYLWCLVSP